MVNCNLHCIYHDMALHAIVQISIYAVLSMRITVAPSCSPYANANCLLLDKILYYLIARWINSEYNNYYYCLANY